MAAMRQSTSAWMRASIPAPAFRCRGTRLPARSAAGWTSATGRARSNWTPASTTTLTELTLLKAQTTGRSGEVNRTSCPVFVSDCPLESITWQTKNRTRCPVFDLNTKPLHLNLRVVEHAESQLAGDLDVLHLAVQERAEAVGLRRRDRSHPHLRALGVDRLPARLVERHRVRREVHRLVLPHELRPGARPSVIRRLYPVTN